MRKRSKIYLAYTADDAGFRRREELRQGLLESGHACRASNVGGGEEDGAVLGNEDSSQWLVYQAEWL